MTRSDLKTSRTPFQILADYYQAGDTRDRQLWDEYARATRNRRPLVTQPSRCSSAKRPSPSKLTRSLPPGTSTASW